MAKRVIVPGEILKSKLSEYLVNMSDAAKSIGLNVSSLRLIVIGKSRISVDLAFRLAKYFKTTAEFWLKAQEDYDLYLAKNDKDLQKDLKAIVSVKKPTKARIAAAAEKDERKKRKGNGLVKKMKASNSQAKTPGKKERDKKAAGDTAAKVVVKVRRLRSPSSPSFAPTASEMAPQAAETPKVDKTPFKAKAPGRRGRLSKRVSSEAPVEPQFVPANVLIKKNGNGDRTEITQKPSDAEVNNGGSPSEGNGGASSGGWLR